MKRVSKKNRKEGRSKDKSPLQVDVAPPQVDVAPPQVDDPPIVLMMLLVQLLRSPM